MAIEVPVGEEVVAGSTRLAAGTAQKLVLNTLTTTAMIRLGHVHGRHMVDVVAANDKLRRRVAGVVADSTGCAEELAWQALQRLRLERPGGHRAPGDRAAGAGGGRPGRRPPHRPGGDRSGRLSLGPTGQCAGSGNATVPGVAS